ncbi:hypothetical protein K4L06_19350 [Lysobacter sp. BMK333-48F3]|uniref:hypothetical protein n=1 Tax=Lysobacter sp. BMK333-48F3 TaxID=2867962 RepID=UPI001C8B5E27|nr:hypothetical protein [Lysobacter sp. BMK333-48F3]MBX9403475.1 hypothetical protein [Lysobacter sp. BMK333-48F3]
MRASLLAGWLAAACCGWPAAQARAAAADSADAARDCARIDQVVECLSWIETRSSGTGDADYLGRVERHAGDETRVEIDNGGQRLEVLLLGNGRRFVKGAAPGPMPEDPAAYVGLVAAPPLLWLGMLLDRDARWPAPGASLERTASTDWAYGQEQYRVRIQAEPDASYAVEIVKTATVTRPEPAQAPDPSGQFATLSTSEDRAARLAELAPVGMRIAARVRLQPPSAPLPDDFSLQGWTPGKGAPAATLGEARRTPR